MRLLPLALALAAAVLPLSANAEEAQAKSYFEWAEARGLAGIFGAPEADFDGNGVTNLMSYALDLDGYSDAGTWERLPCLTMTGDPPEPVIEFVLPARVPPDVSYVVELTTEKGKRVEIARKNGRGSWTGAARVSRELRKDGSTLVAVQLPPDMDPPPGDTPLHLKVEFLPSS